MLKIVISALMLFSAAAQAQSNVYKEVGEWSLMCVTKPPQTPMLGDCWIGQSLALSDNQNYWASVDFRYTGAEEARMLFTIPELPAKSELIGVRVDNVPFVDFRLGDCTDGVCEADIHVSDDSLKQLLASKRLIVKYKVSDGNQVLIPFDFARFGEALKELRALMGLKN